VVLQVPREWEPIDHDLSIASPLHFRDCRMRCAGTVRVLTDQLRHIADMAAAESWCRSTITGAPVSTWSAKTIL
jgi:hypothetical protein